MSDDSASVTNRMDSDTGGELFCILVLGLPSPNKLALASCILLVTSYLAYSNLKPDSESDSDSDSHLETAETL